ncbi:K+-transporting ATPase ATPase B chain [Thermodesulfobium acidiphilum]|uniref:Potassium-transporting ATPase ATP-binding subunit n=1 Tax=Thermodesulfobium acidiphilum TaxID=1794699 RepID=A0A2R4W0P4_THEAF|nr:potassium-transporting ATPase subunit KdpB [Thermodesulfobium acidiphilum]AWB10379.1 K+-transporting ATPase ATPase B chain [Thermodesulfobium acidiphilum]
MSAKKSDLYSPEIFKSALINSFKKLNPKDLISNPVMFSVEIGSILTTIEFIHEIISGSSTPLWFTGWVSVWLWFTVIFSNFAEAFSESRGKARAESLKKSKTQIMAKKIDKPTFDSKFELIPSTSLKKGDFVLVEQDDLIPGDGEVVSGAALVNESAVTGESAPVVREAGGDRSAVTGGTKVISNSIIVKITSNPGETFLDRMISMVESAKRRKTPNEVALEVLLIALTVVFFFVVINLRALSIYSVNSSGHGSPVSLVVLIALFVCLAPTTIAALLPAIGIAGMDRLFRKNVVALSGKAVEAAGDVNVLLLDKTGTITLGNRQAADFIPVGNYTKEECAKIALMSSLTDETPEGRSIVVLAKEKYNLRFHELPANVETIPFSVKTRMSGTNINSHRYRKGSLDAISEYITQNGGKIPENLEEVVMEISKLGSTPLVVTFDNDIVGVINLKDILKTGIKERFMQLRKMGIKTVMITGDNPLTAATIAAEAGVDDFLAQAKPEDKLRLVKEYQQQGLMVAMTGDGTNDAPALAQADVAVAMNTGTQAAREAANVIDLDSSPTKLLDIVDIGKQLLMTRGALTTFSISNDIAKYFVIIPAAVISIYPQLSVLNIMQLSNPFLAILSAVIFNAVVIPLLTPLALKGVWYKPMNAESLLTYNLLIYGGGGIIAPFIGIKLIYLFLSIFI